MKRRWVNKGFIIFFVQNLYTNIDEESKNK